MQFGKNRYALILLTLTYFLISISAFGDMLFVKNSGRSGSNNKFD